METCCRAISRTQTVRVGEDFSHFHFPVVHNSVKKTHVSLTCVVSRVAVGVQELLHAQRAGQQRMLGDRVQIRLQAFLPLRYELSVHVADQLLGGEGQTDAAHLDTVTNRCVCTDGEMSAVLNDFIF